MIEAKRISEILHANNDRATLYKEFLFSKNFLVGNTETTEHQVEVGFGLAKKFNILIDKGLQYATVDCIHDAQYFIGDHVPQSFYKGFPQSVYNLTSEELLFDQLHNYFQTYYLGNFDETQYSIIESEIKRTALNEKVPEKHFVVLSELEAYEKLIEGAENLLESTRPLSESNMMLIVCMIQDFGFRPKNCASHDTAVNLLYKTNDTYYTKFLNLSDVLKLLEKINISTYGNDNLKKINLKNKDRVLLKNVLDIILKKSSVDDFKTACEKKKIWNGFLHHIHYKNKDQTLFLNMMRGDENFSAYSVFEKKIKNNAADAANSLEQLKGSASVLRHLNYLLSRAKDASEIEKILDVAGKASNPIVLLQLYLQYVNYSYIGARNFKFTKNYKAKNHTETAEEIKRRKSLLTKEIVEVVKEKILVILEKACKGKLSGKVYIDEAMKNIAVPIQETTSSSGYGVLPKGSKVDLNGKNVRAFTYWEKVDDIDLASFVLDEAGTIIEEFSWRTNSSFNGRNNYGITFSGDCTSGFNGGSEYFDIDIEKLTNKIPNARYLIFTDNVYSDSTFDKVFCKAGFMLRENMTAGKVFEPKTVATSFQITAETTYGILFMLDLKERKMIWLNTADNRNYHVAGQSDFEWIVKAYANFADTLNLYKLFSMLGEVTDSQEEATIVVSDKPLGENDPEAQKTIIRSCDIDKILALMN